MQLWVFGVHQERINTEDARVGTLAKKLIRCLLMSVSYLRFKPSQIAAAALMLGSCSSTPVSDAFDTRRNAVGQVECWQPAA